MQKHTRLEVDTILAYWRPKTLVYSTLFARISPHNSPPLRVAALWPCTNRKACASQRLVAHSRTPKQLLGLFFKEKTLYLMLLPGAIYNYFKRNYQLNPVLGWLVKTPIKLQTTLGKSSIWLTLLGSFSWKNRFLTEKKQKLSLK